MRRFFALSHADQIRVGGVIAEYLAGGHAEESPVEKARRERAQAVADVMAVAAHLGHGTDQKVLTSEYDAVREQLGLMGRSKVTHAFDGRWSDAQTAAMGGRPAESPAQRSQRRLWSGRERTHEGHLHGLRTWLETKPSTHTMDDYERWRVQRNASHPDEPPLVQGSTIVRGLGPGWTDCLAVAQGRMSLEDALAGTAAATDRLRLPTGEWVVTTRRVAAQLGMRRAKVNERTSQQPAGFPQPVLTLGHTRVWMEEDITAHLAEAPLPVRTPDELAGRLLGSQGTADRVGRPVPTFVTMVHQEKWHAVPRPFGRLGRLPVWWAKDVDAWIAEQPQSGPRPLRTERYPARTGPRTPEETARRDGIAAENALRLPSGELLLATRSVPDWIGMSKGRFRTLRAKDSFPPPVVLIERVMVWSTEDLDAWEAGNRSWPERSPRLDGVVITQSEVARLLGVTLHRLDTLRVHERWQQALTPAGRFGLHPVWLREDIERLAARPPAN